MKRSSEIFQLLTKEIIKPLIDGVLIIKPCVFKAQMINNEESWVRIPTGGRIKSIQNLIIIGNE